MKKLPYIFNNCTAFSSALPCAAFYGTSAEYIVALFMFMGGYKWQAYS